MMPDFSSFFEKETLEVFKCVEILVTVASTCLSGRQLLSLHLSGEYKLKF